MIHVRRKQKKYSNHAQGYVYLTAHTTYIFGSVDKYLIKKKNKWKSSVYDQQTFETQLFA